MTESPVTRHIRRILLVEDDVAVRNGIRRALRSTGHTIVEAPTLAAALELLPTGFDLVLLDVGLPDGSGIDVAVAASKSVPAPLIVAMSGQATAQEAFGLAQLGVVQFVTKPFSVDQLLRAIERITEADLRFQALVKTYVGRQTLRELQAGLRNTMVQEALAMTSGNRSEAAKLLRITRQAIQKFIRAKRRARKG